MKQSKNEAQASESGNLVAQLNLLAEKIVTFGEGIVRSIAFLSKNEPIGLGNLRHIANAFDAQNQLCFLYSL